MSDTPKLKVYLSAPMSGHLNLNRPMLAEITKALREKGYTVFNPGELGIDDWVQAMKLCVKALPDYDYLIQLPGWEGSRGATVEYALATILGLDVITLKWASEHLGLPQSLIAGN